MGCIRYLRKAAPALDPRNPRDILELARHVSSYFADPGRKFAQEISRLELELTTVESEKAAAVEAEQSRLKKAAGEVERLASEFSDYKSTVERRESKRRASLRLAAAWMFTLCVVVVIGVVAGLQSGTDSVFDKVSAAWRMMSGLGGFAGIVATWVFVGPERLKLLGIKLPFQR